MTANFVVIWEIIGVALPVQSLHILLHQPSVFFALRKLANPLLDLLLLLPHSEDWESIVYDRDTVDFREKEQRDRYISGCLEQIAEASKEISLLTGEYSLVTSYLTDMEDSVCFSHSRVSRSISLSSSSVPS